MSSAAHKKNDDLATEMSNALYDDEYSRVEKGTLIIKWFYFPTSGNKKINVEDIKGLYYRLHNFKQDVCHVKNWGMSFTPCWWACDMSRCMHSEDYYNVVVDNGESTYKGFSCAGKQLPALLSALRPQLPPSCELGVDRLPF